MRFTRSMLRASILLMSVASASGAAAQQLLERSLLVAEEPPLAPPPTTDEGESAPQRHGIDECRATRPRFARLELLGSGAAPSDRALLLAEPVHGHDPVPVAGAFRIRFVRRLIVSNGPEAIRAPVTTSSLLGASDAGPSSRGGADSSVRSQPVGVVFSPVERLSIGVNANYRLSFTHGSGSPERPVGHYVPVGFDLVVRGYSLLDLGVTASLVGYVGTTAGAGTSSSFAELSQFKVWMGGRF